MAEDGVRIEIYARLVNPAIGEHGCSRAIRRNWMDIQPIISQTQERNACVLDTLKRGGIRVTVLSH